jgi:CMP-N-acetylneuraminic acid synthetase
VIGLIIAKSNSVGLPGKNRMLFEHSANAAINSLLDDVVVSTDDYEIQKMARDLGIFVHKRPSHLCDSKSSVKDVVEEFIKFGNTKKPIFVLYPTFPRRDEKIIDDAIEMFIDFPSMIGFKAPKTHPYLCYNYKEHQMKRIIPHNLYRRQDYPPVWEICHAVCIVNPECLDEMDPQMIHENTRPYFFMSDWHTLDIDTEEDMEEFENG